MVYAKDKKRKITLAIVIVVITGIIFAMSNPFKEDEIAAIQVSGKVGTNIGQEAPDFTLQTSAGSVSLSDLRGKPVLINFWASWCPFCIDEMPDLQTVYEENEGLVVLGINRGEDIDTATKYLENELPVNITYPLLFDPTEVVSKVYIKVGMPVSYFVDSKGIIVDRKFGPMALDEIRTRTAKIVITKPAPKTLDEPEEKSEDVAKSTDIEPIQGDEIMITDGKKHIVPLDKIFQGCLGGKDCIPSIDNPKFMSVAQADRLLDDEDVVLGIEVDGKTRAYPLQILDWHEIVNDDIAGQKIVITYCPLCGTGIAYERVINGKTVEFGVSGKLYNSGLVMYDRDTETYWDQVTGRAIVGELTGLRLKPVPIDTALWKGWKEAHPETEVLSRDTGYIRPYGTYPYGDYKTNSRINFPIENRDSRLHSKALVYGVEINDSFKAYSQETMAKVKIANDEVGGKRIVAVYNPSTTAVRIFEREINGEMLEFSSDALGMIDGTGNIWDFDGTAKDGRQLKQIVHVTGFWFAWATFHPSTELYE